MENDFNNDYYTGLTHKVRLVMLLNAAENAGLVPIPILRLHTLAYLANVLAPVWDMPAIEGKILKRRGGPFYPKLQRDLDRLVGMGVAIVVGVTHVLDEDKRWRLEGSYRLNPLLGRPIVNRIDEFRVERQIASFIQELAYALSALSDEEMDGAMKEDATYSDPVVGVGNVVDFSEWQQRNFSSNAARSFANLLPGKAKATPGEQIHLYVRHLHARMNRGGK